MFLCFSKSRAHLKFWHRTWPTSASWPHSTFTLSTRYTPRALSRGCSPKHVYSYGQQPETRNPPSAISQARVCHPIVHVSRFSKFKFFPPQIPTPAILRLNSQSISGRHLAVALATTFTLNLCHFSNSPPKSIYHYPPFSHNVKNPKPMSKTRNRKYKYRPPLSTDSNHLRLPVR